MGTGSLWSRGINVEAAGFLRRSLASFPPDGTPQLDDPSLDQHTDALAFRDERPQGRRGDGEAYSPSHSGPFPPGTEGTVISDRASGWLELRLLDGTRSWVREGTVERVLAGSLEP